MPSDQFFVTLVDTNICSLDTETTTVTAQEYGETQLLLHDRSILSVFP